VTEVEFSSHQLPLGSLETDGKKFAKIALKDGFLVLKEVQAPNKKRMEIGEFLRGLR
jgi:methionyl-tRNA formyltransferase